MFRDRKSLLSKERYVKHISTSVWKSRPGSLHTLLMNRYYWNLHVVLSRESSSTQEWESNCQHSKRNTGHIFKGVERMGGFKMVKHKINGIGRSCWQNFLRGMKLESDTCWDAALGNLQQSEAIHRSPHWNKSMDWDELRVWAACQGVTAGAGLWKLQCSQWIPDTDAEHAINESNVMHCTAGKSAPSAPSARAITNPNVPPSPKAFHQAWDNTLGNQGWLRREEFASGQITSQFVLGTLLDWHKEEKQPAAQLSPVCCHQDGGKPRKYMKEHLGFGCRGYSGHF